MLSQIYKQSYTSIKFKIKYNKHSILRNISKTHIKMLFRFIKEKIGEIYRA